MNIQPRVAAVNIITGPKMLGASWFDGVSVQEAQVWLQVLPVCWTSRTWSDYGGSNWSNCRKPVRHHQSGLESVDSQSLH